MRKTEITNRRYEQDTFLGIKCVGNSREFYTETETTTCDVCGDKRVLVLGITELLHVPMTQTEIIDSKGPLMQKYNWGYKMHSFYACETHSEIELDKYVAGCKKRGGAGGE